MDSAAEASSAAREAPLLPEDVVARIEQLRGKSAAEGARTFREIATVVHQCSTQARSKFPLHRVVRMWQLTVIGRHV